MKRLIILFLLIAGVAAPEVSKASNGTDPEKPKTPQITSFTVDYNSPKLYFNVVTQNLSSEGLFIFERKEGDNYVPVAVKESVGGNIDLPILYSAEIEDADFTYGTFRVRFWGDNGIVTVGEEMISLVAEVTVSRK
jgi:hypothetical protein